MKLKEIKRDWRRVARNLFLTVAGTVVLAFGTAIFILPFSLVAGGVSSLALILKQVLPFDFITLDLLVTVVTWGLFFVGLFVLGKSFAAKTLVSSIVYPVAVSLFLRLTDPDVFGGFFCLQSSPYADTSLILASTVGGVLVGVGCALTFLGGGSTGGVDILAFTICKIFRRLKSSVVIFCIDAATIVLGMFVLGDFVLAMLGVLSALISALMVDRVFLGGSRAFIAHIVSAQCDAISADVITKMERTTTRLQATGGYSGEQKEMLMVSFTMSQYATLMSIIARHDKEAFVTVHRAHEINGEGWTR